MNALEVSHLFNSYFLFRLGIDAVGTAGGVVEAAVCYTGDVTDPKRGLYDLEYYLNFVRELEAEGIHVLAIKDMVRLQRFLLRILLCICFIGIVISSLISTALIGWIIETKC